MICTRSFALRLQAQVRRIGAQKAVTVRKHIRATEKMEKEAQFRRSALRLKFRRQVCHWRRIRPERLCSATLLTL